MGKCERCKLNDTLWAMQYMVPETPTFSMLGWHYPGLKMTLLCGKCASNEVDFIKNNSLDSGVSILERGVNNDK